MFARGSTENEGCKETDISEEFGANVEGVVVTSRDGGCCGLKWDKWVIVPRDPFVEMHEPYDFTVFCPRPMTANISLTWSCPSLKSVAFHPVAQDVTQNFLLLKLQEVSELNKMEAVSKFLPFSRLIPWWQKGCSMLVECTPFLELKYFNSWFKGILSNYYGGFLLLDIPLTESCRGAPVFMLNKERRKCVGMIVLETVFSKKERIGFSIAISLEHLITPLIQIHIPHITSNSDSSDRVEYEEPVFHIRCGNFHGSGCLIHATDNEGIIITCAHILKFGELEDDVYIYHSSLVYKGHPLYIAKEKDQYDIALISMPKTEVKPFIIASSPPLKGEQVYAIGHIKLYEEGENIKTPTTTAGIVALPKGRNLLISSTCLALRGSSGGAIVRPNKELLGVTQSTLLDNQNGIIYSDFSFFIPVNVIISSVRKFIGTKDISGLVHLQNSGAGGNFLFNSVKCHL